MPETITLESEPHWTRLKTTFEKLISRHEALRTFFPVVSGDPVQRIHDSVTFALEVIEEEIAIEDLIRPFNLAKSPLLRVAAIKRSGGEYVLLVDMHHIISDGVSHEILEQDFLSLYQGDRLQPLTVQYKDYCLWQTGSMQQQSIERQGAFWLRQFCGDIPVMNLPTDFPRPAIRDFAGGSLLFEIDAETTASLRRLNDAEGMTMFMTLLAAFSILLAKICGQPEVVVGTPVAGRRHQALEQVIGMFVNTLAMRLAPGGDKSVLDYIREVRKHVIQAFDNQDFPFDDLVERAHVQRDTGRNPLFDVMFAFHNTKEFEKELERWGQDNEPEAGLLFQNQTSKFDMTLTGLEAGDCLYFRLQYNSRLFSPETVKRFSRYYLRIIEGMTGQSSPFIREIEITGRETQNLFNKKENEESEKQPMTADFDF